LSAQNVSSSTAPGGALLFILFTAFLNQMGVGIVVPVLPSLIGRYVPNETVPLLSGILFTAFSFFQFIAVPGMGALSDRHGRRPILLISLLGSAVGYFLFGVGGAWWVLLLGRSIDGITGGNLSTIYAYGADITSSQERTRYFGMIGAASSIGFIIGPAIGGLFSRVSYEAPMYIAAAVTLGNVLLGYVSLPESLPLERRAPAIQLRQLNPFTQLMHVFAMPQLRWLLVSTFLWAMAFAAMQSNLAVLTKERLNWTPDLTSTIYLVLGVMGIIVQGGVVRRLVGQFGESKLAIAGLFIMALGFLIIAAVAFTGFAPLIYVAVVVTSLGNGLVIPTLAGLVSQLVTPREQGRVQGGSQSVQALARVVGPLWAGTIYALGSGVPYLIGAILLSLSAFGVVAALTAAQRGKMQGT
jgi:DHA1 family tetracycline resistance protein-like MFS transporter